MTRKGKWRALAVILTAGMLSSQALPVYAAPVTVAGEGTTVKNNAQYDGQDDITALATNPATFNVQAKVSGGPEIIYSVDIEWGAMQFEYDYGSTWNPSTHTYGAGTSGNQGGGWVVSSYVDGTNNKITVTNNSNFPVTADFAYTGGTALNTDPTVAGSVIGIFSYTNSELQTASVLAAGLNGNITPATSTPTTMTLEMNVASIDVGTGYYFAVTDPKLKTNGDEDSTDDIYFALSGKPDNGGPTTFTDVGQISVTIAPAHGANYATK